MDKNTFPDSLENLHIHLVGAKGTGMAALAEILSARGAILSGSDVPEHFYTDDILAALKVSLYEGFDPAHLPEHTDLVIHSAAYGRERNPELQEAVRRNLPVFTYPEALGALSRLHPSAGIAGVHGKTTTTAMTGSILRALDMPATVLAGSAVSSFGGTCTMIAGNQYFVAETCEYRKHFLNFSPRWIVLTSVESDHQDYFPTYESIRDAFVEYAATLPRDGALVYCADDHGAVEVADRLRQLHTRIQFLDYGFSATSAWKVQRVESRPGAQIFQLAGSEQEFSLHVPGRHLVLDATAALALAELVFRDWKGRGFGPYEWERAAQALATFGGSRRRSEVIAEKNGILILDDYGHHPTAIAATIEGIKAFWPGRRLIVDFMSHTYSRTISLQDQFAAAFRQADAVIMHRIYPSARETPMPGFDGRTLHRLTSGNRKDLFVVDLDMDENDRILSALDLWKRHVQGFSAYSDAPESSVPFLLEALQEGDILLTMGAGDNWKVGAAIAKKLSEGQSMQSKME
ncbi:MAG: UDP-N-acetylmuramate--L-alanine ligase [Rectinemataceae bacterium]